MTTTTKADRLEEIVEKYKHSPASLTPMDFWWMAHQVERLRAENEELCERRVKLESWVLDEMKS